jgi:hypothetical protein
MLIGLALYNNVLLDVRFPAALWRKLLAPESEHLNDLPTLGTVYPEVARNLQTAARLRRRRRAGLSISTSL